jgi:outer membrane protein TolC
VFSNNAQVVVARSSYFPQINALAGTELRSSPLTDNIRASKTGYIFGATGTWAVWDWGATFGKVKQAEAILEQSKVTLDDDVRQVELEVQQAYANILQGRELVKATEKSVEQADEALRLASARLDAGAGTQLEVLDARTQLTTAQSNRLQALYTYNSAVAEFDRATATEVKYSVCVDEPRTRARLHSEPQATPGPKPTPLPLKADCGATTSTTQTKTAKSSIAK